VRFLIVAGAEDALAVRVAAELIRRHSASGVAVVTPEELVLAPRIRCRSPGTSGFTLHNGIVLEEQGIGVVFNRLRTAPVPHFQNARPADRDYAQMELFALLLSWLASLRCQVVNRPSPQALGGCAWSEFAWRHLAAQAGLPVPPMRLTSSSRRYGVSGLPALPLAQLGIGDFPAQYGPAPDGAVGVAVVMGDAVAGPLPDGWRQPAIALARTAGVQLLAIYYAAIAGEIYCYHADPFPMTHAAEIAGYLESLAA
jgi:hypothetical protein